MRSQYVRINTYVEARPGQEGPAPPRLLQHRCGILSSPIALAPPKRIKCRPEIT